MNRQEPIQIILDNWSNHADKMKEFVAWLEKYDNNIYLTHYACFDFQITSMRTEPFTDVNAKYTKENKIERI